MKKNNNYFIGLDLGTTSVGWAATDEDYKLLHLNRKPAIGVNLFDEAKTAQARRVYRGTRRRLDRRHKRILLLQSLFAEEVAKVDPTFFLRLNNSPYFQEDKDRTLRNTKNSLFDDPEYKDKDFFKEYPTIYHLQKDIIFNGKKKFDIRHIYLAAHHLIKYRGNFIKEGETLNIEEFTESLVTDAFKELSDFFDEIEYLAAQNLFIEENIKKYKEILSDKSIGGMTKTAERLFDTFEIKDRYLKNMIKLSLGGSIKLSQMFDENIVDKADGKQSVDFKGESFEEKYMEITTILGEEYMALIDALKTLYDYFVISRLMGGKKFVAEAMVDKFDKHKKDLRKLKNIFIKHGTKEQYREVFTNLYVIDKDGKKKANPNYNYPRYIGEKHKDFNLPHQDYSEFAKFLRSMFKELEIEELPEVKAIMEELNDRLFLPRLNSKDNATIPYQFNEYQLGLILQHQSAHYPFLKEKGNDALTTAEKIISILRFRIPYYVGPLVEEKDHPFAWVKRNSFEKVTPWNFKEVINEEESARRFIERMTNKCSYIPTEDVLPKESLLYQEFDVLNRINSLKINDALIDEHAKKKILDELYRSRLPITKKKLVALLSSNKNDVVAISGFQDDEKLVLSSHHKFETALVGHKLSDAQKEEIIFYRTIFTDQKMYEKKLLEIVGGKLPKEVLKNLKNLKFKDWGRLSRAFLTGTSPLLNAPITVNEKTGEHYSIIDIMRDNRLNLQEILFSEKYNILSIINDYNYSLKGGEKSFVETVEESYLSPSVKRPVLKALYIIEEIIKLNKGVAPQKIFLEVTRSEDLTKKGKKTASRKEQLQELYKKTVKDSKELKKLLEELNNTLDTDLKSRKLFLYYLQEGKCLYSGNPIKLEELASGTYDIEHIIPRSLKTDDSFSNICLVEAKINKDKGDTYPLPREIINVNRMMPFWKSLKDKGLMTERKYQSLIRVTPLTEEEKYEFINRQLVETGQANKMVADIINSRYGDIVVYSKAQNISRFRQKFDMIKIRDLNKAHHAHDAYLNIVVGNYYDSITKAMALAKKRNYEFHFNPSKAFEENERTDVWNKKNNLKQIRDVLARKNINFTRATTINTGEFYNQNLSSSSAGKLIPIVEKGPLADVSKYGGYTKLNISHFAIADIQKGKKTERRMIPVTIFHYAKIKSKTLTLEDYLMDTLGVKEARVVIDIVPLNSVIKREKTLRFIAGFNDLRRNIMHNASEPYFDKNFEKAFYYLSRFIREYEETKKENKDYDVDTYTFIESDNKGNITNKFSIDQSLMNYLYEELCAHFSKDIYKHIFKDTSEIIKDNKQTFNEMTLIEKAKIINNIVMLLQTGPLSPNINLTDIGLNVSINRNIISNTILKGDKLVIQSITGLYEREINIG